MYRIKEYRVVPLLPEKLSYLKELAYNLYWTWDHESQSLFRRIDVDLWEKTNRNPVLLLGSVDQGRLEELAKNSGYVSQLNRVETKVKDYMQRQTWFEQEHGDKNFNIAYFSMEFGLTKGLPVYSGGLGILAGDHIKSASDLGLPFIGVGLLYQEGYFQQYLAKDGWQQETYPQNDFYNLPIIPVKNPKGNSLKIEVEFPGRVVTVQIWKAQIGRLSLYLLDTNINENSPDDRYITAQLYGGDDEMRIKQEIILGIGGVRALKALDIKPQVCHMNEGHSAFLALERIRQMMFENGQSGLTFEQALEATRGGNVFTTHTPVPAGIDRFDTNVLDDYLAPYYKEMKVTKEQFFQLGGVQFDTVEHKFNMAIFAINTAGNYNGVSKLHGQVARNMWHYLWPETPENEVPIGHVTNGVHVRSWISEDLSELFYRYLGSDWYRNPANESQWKLIPNIPDEELWRTHERRRERLVAITRESLRTQLQKMGASPSAIDYSSQVLNPEALTIGFARRFAAYKRAFLLFKDTDRLLSILNNKERPVQIIIAGKAHPRDKIGKGIIKNLIDIIRQEEFRQHIVFLENYDMRSASYLVQGVDVWLNNPRRPREASGTSGMKAGANGGLNVSILDGWWDEAYENDLGWAIGRGEEYDNSEEQDQIESEALYHLLENSVVPTFYNRTPNDLPREWVSMMKKSMQVTCPKFNTNRMVREYLKKYYLPAAERYQQATANNLKIAKELVEWKSKITANWDKVDVKKVELITDDKIRVGESLGIKAEIYTDGITPTDLCVDIYYGHLDTKGQIEDGKAIKMNLVKSTGQTHSFEAKVPCYSSGKYGFSVRILPYHDALPNPHETGLVRWFNAD